MSENRLKTGGPNRKAPRSAFKPGQSGNPGGRPKLPPEVVEVRELARQHTLTAIQAIIDVAKNAKMPAAARVSAANAILDRGWGKPAQPLEGANGKALFPEKLLIELGFGK